MNIVQYVEWLIARIIYPTNITEDAKHSIKTYIHALNIFTRVAIKNAKGVACTFGSLYLLFGTLSCMVGTVFGILMWLELSMLG